MGESAKDSLTPIVKVGPSRIGRVCVNESSLRLAALSLSVLVYAIWSTPFPKNPGVPEMVVGLLLLASVGVREIAYASGGFLLWPKRGPLSQLLYGAFLYLLIVPLVIGVFRGWDIVDVVRDVIPLGYLFFPLFLLPIFIQTKRPMGMTLAWVLSWCGVIISVRFFLDIGESPLAVGETILIDKLYLPYDPTVLFSAVFLLIMAFDHLHGRKSIVVAIASAVGGMLALASLVSIVQRGPIFLTAISLFVFVFMTASRSLVKGLVISVFGAIMLYMTWDQVVGAVGLISEKQGLVGMNEKDQELSAILAEISSSWHTLLTGIGWGGVFVSPASKLVRVSYTHSLVSYSVLKTGLLGTLAVGIYWWRIGGMLVPCVFKNYAVAAASSSVVVVGVLFQPSYKTLTFGLIVLCLMACSIDLRRQHASAP